jgi:hypothetical protein
MPQEYSRTAVGAIAILATSVTLYFASSLPFLEEISNLLT